jgi:thiol-disulfide isomerase/thioredoxin
LRGGSLAAVGALAGCIGAGEGTAGDGSGGGETGGGSGTTTTDGSDGLVLSTLDVAGSPGGEVTVDPSGTVTLLDFFATWCAPCKPQMAHIREVEARFPDVHFLSITSERDREAIRSFWTEYEGTWPVAQDPELRATSKYNAGQLPTMLVVDAEGNEVWRHVGLSSAEDIAEELRAAGATEA